MNIQKDLDDGKFNQICSNETTFKNYIYEILDSLIDDKSLEDESNGRYNREIELRESIKNINNMNTPKTIQEIEQCFYKKFNPLSEHNLVEIKKFIRQSILSILDSIPLKEKTFPERESDEYDEGWNDKTKEIKALINKIRYID